MWWWSVQMQKLQRQWGKCPPTLSACQPGSICEWDRAFMELSKFGIIDNICMLLLWPGTAIINASLKSQREPCDGDLSSQAFAEESELPEQVEMNEWGVKHVKLLFIANPPSHSHLSYQQSLLLSVNFSPPCFSWQICLPRGQRVRRSSTSTARLCVFLSKV